MGCDDEDFSPRVRSVIKMMFRRLINIAVLYEKLTDECKVIENYEQIFSRHPYVDSKSIKFSEMQLHEDV